MTIALPFADLMPLTVAMCVYICNRHSRARSGDGGSVGDGASSSVGGRGGLAAAVTAGGKVASEAVGTEGGESKVLLEDLTAGDTVGFGFGFGVGRTKEYQGQ